MSRFSKKGVMPLPDTIGALTLIFTTILLLLFVNFSERSYAQATTQQARISTKQLELSNTASYLLKLEVNGKTGMDILRECYYSRDFSSFDRLVKDYRSKTSGSWGISVYWKDSGLYQFSSGVAYAKSEAQVTVEVPIKINDKFEMLRVVVESVDNV